MLPTDSGTERTMRMLITGASSGLAVGVLHQLLQTTDAEIWCGRHPTDILSQFYNDVKVWTSESDIDSALSGLHFDMVLHLAGITHSSDGQQYWKVNFQAATPPGACRLRKWLSPFLVDVSKRCATLGAGSLRRIKACCRTGTSEVRMGKPAYYSAC